jgi:HK97 family phage prohead protease
MTIKKPAKTDDNKLDDKSEDEDLDLQQRGLYAKYDPKTKTAVASTSVIDRQGESIDQGGWDLTNFKQNPVILWAHDHTKPAIGSAPDMRVSRAGGEKKLVFTPQFHDKTEDAKAIKFLYEGDEDTPPVLNSFSVGFIPKEFDPENQTYTKAELLEVSAVNVPANPEAHMLAYKALKEQGFKSETIENLGISTKVLDKVTKLEKDVEDLKSLVKAKIPAAPKAKVLNKRQMMAKAISKAADILLQGDKHNHLSTDQKKTLVKVIKKASEKISTSQKEDIRNG